MGISGRWCENQGDQINLARALNSKSTKHCPCQTAAHSGLASISALPPSHTPYTWSPSCTPQNLRTARPAPSEQSRTEPPPCEQKARPQSGWGPVPGAHSEGTSGQEPLTAPACPAAVRTPPLPQTPSEEEEKTEKTFSSTWTSYLLPGVGPSPTSFPDSSSVLSQRKPEPLQSQHHPGFCSPTVLLLPFPSTHFSERSVPKFQAMAARALTQAQHERGWESRGHGE